VRFAFKTSPQDTTWAAMLEVWRAADDIEVFESGWTSDHFYPMHTADLSGSRLEGWMTLTALAQATRRLRLGTLVTGIHYRHPAVLANMAATLDIVSGGDWRSASEPAGTSRSPAPTASKVPFNGDPAETAATATALGAAGAELAIIYLRPPYAPSVLEPLARALSAS
jgi:hypothetical protein